MNRCKRLHVVGFAALALIVLGAGCSSKSKAARRIARADHYYAQKQYREAAIEYRNALRADPENAHAIRQLGMAFYQTADFRQAFPFLRKAVENDPDDTELRLNLGRIYIIARAREEAKTQAEAVLDMAPTNLQAMVLLLDSATSSNELVAATERLKAGEEQFKHAAVYHSAIAKTHVLHGRLEDAETSYLKAREVDPANAASHLALATFYLQTRRPDEAAACYQRAAELAPENAAIQARWATFRLERGQVAEARAIAEAALVKAPDDRLCMLAMAKIALKERKLDECDKYLAEVLAQTPSSVDALLVRAALAMARGKPADAVSQLEELCTRFPKTPSLRIKLASTRLRNRQVRRAVEDLQAAVAMAPKAVQPRIMLAELQIRTGDAESAIRHLEGLIKTYPDMAPAHTLLGTAHGTLKAHEKAIASFQRAVDIEPENPAPLYMLASALRSSGALDDAEKALQEVLRLRPGFTPALGQLVRIDVARKKPEAAIARLKAAAEAQPKSGAIRYMLGRLYAANRQQDKALEALQEALKLNPGLSGAYRTLASLYASTGKQQEALDKIEGALSVNPRDVSAWMMAALLLQSQGKNKEACERYEKALEIVPGFVPAANNLAYIYNSDPAKRDRAFELAMAAHERVPDNAFVADTFGWILFNRKEHKWAYRILSKSAEQLPDHPDALYHFAVAAAALGRESEARDTLKEILDLTIAEERKTAASALLGVLAVAPDTPDTASEQAISAFLKTEPTSAPALLRVARRQDLQGRTDSARKTYRQAIEANPHFLPGYVNLIDLLLRAGGDAEAALALARTAQEIFPQSPGIAHRLAWASYRAGQHASALSSLRQAAAQDPKDPTLRYRLAVVLHATGHTGDAVKTMAEALALGGAFAEADRVRRDLRLLRALQSGTIDAAATDLAAATLKQDPRHLAALLISAKSAAKRGKTGERMQTLERVVAGYPDYMPAAVDLAAVYLDRPGKIEDAFRLAAKARERLPRDHAVALVLGRIALKRDSVEWAVQLLEEGLAGKEDPDAYYSLGLAQQKLGKQDKAVAALQKAVQLGKDRNWLEDAQKNLKRLQDEKRP